MPDMDLRVVLAEAPCTLKSMPGAVCSGDHETKHPECALARLSQPDVQDEFERRFDQQLPADIRPFAGLARKVLSGMLGGALT